MTRLVGHGWTQRGNLPTQGIKVLEFDTKGGFNISFTTTPGYSDNASSLNWSGQ
jgi:hypothetical protein